MERYLDLSLCMTSCLPIPNSKKCMSSQIPENISPRSLFELFHSSSVKPFLVDVREQTELDIAKIPLPFLHLPLSQSSQWIHNIKNLLPKDRPVVVMCHAGIRSLNFGIWLQQQGLNLNVLNLDGGIDAWSIEVDQTVPRY